MKSLPGRSMLDLEKGGVLILAFGKDAAATIALGDQETDSIATADLTAYDLRRLVALASDIEFVLERGNEEA